MTDHQTFDRGTVMAVNTELRAAAEQVAKMNIREFCRDGDNAWRMRMLILFARHILANVPADDGELVTVASLRQKLADTQGAMAADDERLRLAAERVGIVVGCDAPDEMADMIVSLRQQLADATKEIGRVRHDAEIAHAHRRLMERECDRLRAELLQQPPTLEWLRETFGEPNDFDGQTWLWLSSSGADAVRYFIPTSRVEILTQTADLGRIWYAAKDRAAVLAAVAATKEPNDGK